MKTVIFAGEGVAGVAQLAAACFGALADPQKAQAIVAGTKAADNYHPLVAAALREMEVEKTDGKVVVLTPELAKSAAHIVTSVGSSVAKGIQGPQRVEWPPMDSPEDKKSFQEVEPIRDAIAALVSGFVEENGWGRPT
ncbi:arsenate reductase ArsC [Myxococcus hansupus]|uniref:arsenate reductase ArsC n=1 Tax=Pseudomyxococcus hansupus TaxID=1297742 RepID=UPI000B1EDA0B|nr:arsenate reductase ArsC [Myxococcus hansupus]